MSERVMLDVKWSQQKFVVNREAVQNVVQYKYLGCIINDYAECIVMVNYRAKPFVHS